MLSTRWWWAGVVLLFLTFVPTRTNAAEEIIELSLQRVRTLSGIVTYPNGDPVQGARIESSLGTGNKCSVRLRLMRPDTSHLHQSKDEKSTIFRRRQRDQGLTHSGRPLP